MIESVKKIGQNSHTLLAQSGRSESNCVFVDFAFVEVILGLYVLLEEVGGILEWISIVFEITPFSVSVYAKKCLWKFTNS